MDDWASDGEEEGFLGDISTIPTVEAPEPPPPEPEEEPPQQPTPPVNAWTAPNQSGDIRAATRLHHPGSNPPQHHPMPRRDGYPMSQDMRMRPPSDIRARPQSAPGFGPPRQPPGGPVTTLYVSNLPFDTNEVAIAGFFSHCGVTPADVRITRRSDTGNIKFAFVSVRDSFRTEALAQDGKQFGSRPIHVKVDGDRTGGRDGNRQASGRDRERPGYGFGNRERREGGDGPRDRMDRQNSGGRETGWSTGQWVERPGSLENRSNSAGRDGRVAPGGRDGRNAVRTDGSAEQRVDPTIPTGPPPAGRKKLMLKPRTKPPPVLEVDKRAIDGHRPLSAPAAVSSPANEKAEPAEKPTTQSGGAFIRKGSGGRSERWSNSKEAGGSPRSTNPHQTVTKKEDDSKRPVLLNTFAALEVNDSDV